jgi:hypothetical protein
MDGVDRVVVEPSTWKRQPLRRSWSPKPLAAARPPITAGQEPRDTRPTPPSPDEDLLRGHQDPQDRTEALGVTHWSSRLLADQLGISHSTVARVGRASRHPLADRGLQLLQRPGAGGQSPRRGRVVRGAVGACDRAGCGREVADPGAGAHPAFPPPTPGAARRRPRRGAATHRGRLRALPMTGWAGERPACPHLRKLRQ